MKGYSLTQFSIKHRAGCIYGWNKIQISLIFPIVKKKRKRRALKILYIFMSKNAVILFIRLLC